MGLFSTLVEGLRGGVRAEVDANDDRWWMQPWEVLATTAGVTLTPEIALRASCVFRGVRLISETVAGLPLILYRELENGGKERAKDHPLWPKLRRRPNPWQSARQWRENMLAHSTLWGGGFSRIVPGEDGFATWLIPIHPGRVEVQQLDNYRLVFVVRKDDGTEERLVQEEVFYLPGFGVSPLIGTNVLQMAREAIGLWLAMENYSARFFGAGGSSQRLAIEIPKGLTDTAFKTTKERLKQQSGPRSHHSFLVLEHGSQIKNYGFNARDSQLIEARDSQALDIARWLSLPPHMMGVGEHPTYASIEQFAKEFKDYSISPHADRFDGAVENCLLDDDGIFCEHLFDNLLKANTKERADSYRTFVETGIMTRNEVRIRENLNPLPGLDEPLTPMNMQRTNEADATEDPPPARRGGGRRKPAETDEDEPDARAVQTSARVVARPPRRFELLVDAAARRMVRRETEAVVRIAKKLAAKPEAWTDWLTSFYEEHAKLVAESLELEISVARRYCEGHRASIDAHGVALITDENWAAAAVGHLAALALEEADDAA